MSPLLDKILHAEHARRQMERAAEDAHACVRVEATLLVRDADDAYADAKLSIAAAFGAEVSRLLAEADALGELPDETEPTLAALGRELVEGMADPAAPSPVTDAVLAASAVAAGMPPWRTGAHAVGCACVDCNAPF